MVRTSVIIPTLNRPGDLDRCLSSIERLRRGFDEIVIVDQGDREATERVVAGHARLNAEIHHLGFRSAARARNLGVESASGELVFFVDDDTVLDEDYVEIALDYLVRHPKVVGLTGHIEEMRGGALPWRLLKRLAGTVLLAAPLHLRVLRSGAVAAPLSHTTRPWFSDMGFSDVQHLPGGHVVYRSAVFEAGFRFNERLIRRSAHEDLMLSYQIYKHYGRGSLAYLPAFRLRHYSSPERSLTDEADIRMRVLYRFIFWRREVYDGSWVNALCYLYSQMGYSLFLFEQHRHAPRLALRALLESYRYLLANHRDIARERIDYNRFITEGPSIVPRRVRA